MLVTGAGPIGPLAALFAMRVAEEDPCHRPGRRRAQPVLVGDLGAIYHDEPLDRIEERFDVVMECTGDVDLMMVAGVTNPNGIIWLAGVTDDGREVRVSSDLARRLVLENRTVFGTVNANRRIMRRLPGVGPRRTNPGWGGWQSTGPARPIRRGVCPEADDVKTVIQFPDAAP